MRKAFLQNVSKAKPQLKTGLTALAEPTEPSLPAAAPVDPASSVQVQQEEDFHFPRPSIERIARLVAKDEDERDAPATARQVEPVAKRARVEPAPSFPQEPPVVARQSKPVDSKERVRRIKERLRTLRDNPEPAPLPDTMVEAGVVAVERIAALQEEVQHLRRLNDALARDLDVARRAAARSEEEARVRTDEARRLASDMAQRQLLLTDIEAEMQALESERNEVIVQVQEARARVDALENANVQLTQALAEKDAELIETVNEEERLAQQVETLRERVQSLEHQIQSLLDERQSLSEQIQSLTTERNELLEARHALESIHRALARATVRAPRE